jgi:dihydrofolate synthase / folylpolyglutamate synthase
MNNYQQIIDYLFALQRHGIKLTLNNIITLLKSLDNPEKAWPCVHVAGTNGKGSTAAMMESILMKAGYRVGLYTSPHLVDLRERIRINRILIPEKDVIDFTSEVKPLIEKIAASFFEATTAMAFWYFRKEKVDIAIIEVGLGGRLDSTNVVNPVVSVITSIDLDHQKYLGESLEEIATEKAGIIKSNVPCITNNRNVQVLDILARKARSQNSQLTNVRDISRYEIISMSLEETVVDLQIADLKFKELRLNLPGYHQIDNACLAIGAILNLQGIPKISIENVVDGMIDVRWRGRINLITREPFLIIDVSHNASGFDRTLSFLGDYFPKDRLKVVTALQEDKDFRKIGDLLSLYSSEVYVVDLKSGKPLDPSKLLGVLKHKGVKAAIVNSFGEIQEIIFDSKWTNHLWLVIGSHYLAGEAYQSLPKNLQYQRGAENQTS